MAKQFFGEPGRGGVQDQVVDRVALLENASKKAREGVEDEQLKETEFVDLYGQAAVDADLNYVKEMKAKFRESDTPALQEVMGWSTVLEAIIIEQAEQNEWLGPNVHTRRASDFDDIKNGVDVITEIEQDNATSHLALAVDITHGEHLARKFRRIKDEIDRGDLTTVKYFESSSGEFKGRLSKVPRVVIGADRTVLDQVTRLWLDRKNKELASHPIQLQILDEIQMQLVAFAKYARKNGKDDVGDIYDRQLRILETIRQQPDKVKLLDAVISKPGSYLETDHVFHAIADELRQFES